MTEIATRIDDPLNAAWARNPALEAEEWRGVPERPITAKNAPLGQGTVVRKEFNPDEERDERGRWTSGGGDGGDGGTSSTDPRVLVSQAINALPQDQQDRAAHVIRMNGAMLRDGQTTEQLYEHDPTTPGRYSPERDAQLRSIVDEVYARSADVPTERKAWIMGGLGGAGKTTLIRDKGTEFGLTPGRFVSINPDDMKDEILSRGLAPGYDHLNPGELSMQIHEESAYMANILAAKATGDGKNVVYDVTLGSLPKAGKIVGYLQNAGYAKRDITGVFVDVPVSQSIRSALGRWRGGAGRFVDPNIIAHQIDRTGRYNSVNRSYFESAKRLVGRWAIYDNTQRADGSYPQRLVARSGRR